MATDNNQYTVLGTNSIIMTDGAGNPVQGVEISFSFGEGFTGKVRLTLADFNAGLGKSAIQQFISNVYNLM